MLRRVLLAAAAMVTSPALADGPTVLQCASTVISAEAERCGRETEQGAGTVGAYGGCLHQAEQRLGQELSRDYNERNRRSSAAQREALRSAQRAWLAFQKANCDYEAMIGQIEGTSFSHSFRGSCLLMSTAIRLCEIRAFDEYFEPPRR